MLFPRSPDIPASPQWQCPARSASGSRSRMHVRKSVSHSLTLFVESHPHAVKITKRAYYAVPQATVAESLWRREVCGGEHCNTIRGIRVIRGTRGNALEQRQQSMPRKEGHVRLRSAGRACAVYEGAPPSRHAEALVGCRRLPRLQVHK